jgi:cysteine desulfurase
MTDPIVYLDDNASNPIDQRVIDAMADVYADGPANASSSHAFGRRAADRVEKSRAAIAELLDASPSEVVFTSGATEANNLMIGGFDLPRDRTAIAISAGEHPSVSAAARSRAEREGVTCTEIGLTCLGELDRERLHDVLATRTGLVSVVAANSETGVLTDLLGVSETTRRSGAIFHTDATQWVGRLPLGLREHGIDALSLSGHKMCGPQGVGALVARRSVLRQLHPLVHGGGHERGLRSGTLNIAGIVGLGVAAEIAASPTEFSCVVELRDRLWWRIGSVEGAHLNGHLERRLPNTLNVRFDGAPADAVLAHAPNVAASVGSACHAGTLEPSRILLAMGLTRQQARESIRFSLTRSTTPAEIDTAADAIRCAITLVRRLNSESWGNS